MTDGDEMNIWEWVRQRFGPVPRDESMKAITSRLGHIDQRLDEIQNTDTRRSVHWFVLVLMLAVIVLSVWGLVTNLDSSSNASETISLGSIV